MADEPKNDQQATRVFKLNVPPKPAAPPAPTPEAAAPPATPPDAPAPSAPPPEAPASRRADGGGKQTTKRREPYRFLNPYNFVRYLPQSRPDKTDGKDGNVLGDCPPPPHDRYVGLSGRLTCELKAVSPLFIADAHATGYGNKEEEKKKHLTYRFFEYDEQIDTCDKKQAIPASSLRGMLRAVFEAATNSCFTVFDGGRFDLREGRLPAGGKLFPVRVVELDEKGASLEKLDCSRGYPSQVRLNKNRDGRPISVMNAAAVLAYSRRVLDTHSRPAVPFDPNRSLIPEALADGDRVAALINLKPFNKGRYQYFRAEEVVPVTAHHTLTESPGFRKIFGYVHITGPNIENKHDERIFFRWDDADSTLATWQAIPSDKQIKVKSETVKEMVEEYNEHLKGYWERNRREVERLKDEAWPITSDRLPHPSGFVADGRKLKVGDLVYYVPTSKIGISVLRPILISRLPYRHSRGDLLTAYPHFKRCDDVEKLCPACRLFGWVAGTAEAETSKPVAWKGRLRFSHGRPVAGTVREFDEGQGIPLAILSSPKPTTTLFYLRQPDGQQQEERVTYNTEGAQLRGRKVYRHHGPSPSAQEYRRAGGAAKNDDQNRTVRNVVSPGAVFSFTLEFENLAPLELGALL